MKETMQFANVLLPLAAPGLYTYSIPLDFGNTDLIGKRALLRFGKGKKLYTGIVVDTHNEKPDFSTEEILDVIDEEAVVGESVLKFWQWIADYYMCAEGEVMNAALPGIMNLSSESIFMLKKDAEVLYDELNEKEKRVVDYLSENQELNLKEASELLHLKNPIPQLKNMAEKDIISTKEEVKKGYRRKKRKWIGLGKLVLESDRFDDVVLSLKKAPKQLELLMKLIELMEWDGENNEDVFVPKSDLLAAANSGDATLKSLEKKEFVVSEDRTENRIQDAGKEVLDLMKLNDAQTECLTRIKALHREKDVVLLHGVTSSGKTEIYAHLIEEAMQQGKQVLYLLPEISLTSQLIRRLKKYFGRRVAVYHSRLSQNERAEVWLRLLKNDPNDIQIVLGARSSVFLPFKDLGIVIVDEEHDRSYKQQDPSPRYEGRDVSIVLAKLHHAKVLLGSATPSLESFENANSGKYGYVELKKRYGGFEPPEMLAVDLSEERKKRKMKASFSSVLYHQMQETLEAREQIILFQNRRGYAPFVLCNQCAHSPSCVNCDVTLTLHKKRNILICHYCGYSRKMQSNCSECEKGKWEEIGIGTEKIEEELKDLFPNARLARLDLDSTRKKNAFQQLLDDFETGKIDILIGTQMVTKGLDFDNIGLVGIINADNMLRFPDFRSFERTFQMLTQVSGRAGRKKKRGKVIIQTYDPFHPVIQFVLSGNYPEFVRKEKEERKLFKYPPFYRILDVRIKHRDRDVLYKASRELGRMLKNAFGDQLLGPEFPYIERIRNLYSMQLIIKVSKNSSIRNVKKKLEANLADFSSKDTFKSIKIQIDVDPY